MKLVAAYLCKSYYIILDMLMMVCWIVCSVIDAGKSTIGGQILYLSDMVDERTIQKYEREAKDKNRESWYGHCATETDLIVYFSSVTLQDYCSVKLLISDVEPYGIIWTLLMFSQVYGIYHGHK